MEISNFPSNLASSKKVQDALFNAGYALSSLNTVMDVLPNTDLLVELLPLEESRLSCKVENIVTSQDDVFHVFSVGEGQYDAGVRDVLGYHKAISVAWGKDVSVELIERICSSVKRKEMHIRKLSTDSIYLMGSDGSIVYTPPSGNEVESCLNNLFMYLEDSDDNPIIRMVLFHAYFEMIHPLKDGNGRTGRILNEVLLHRFGLLERPVLCLSKFLVDNRADYYRVLHYVEQGKYWDKYVVFMLTGIKESAERAVTLIKEINRSIQRTYSICDALGIPKGVADVVYSHPYVRAVHLVSAGLVSRNTASLYLSKLESAGILFGEQAGKGKIYRNMELMQIISVKL